METMEELKEYVREKALSYWLETDTTGTTSIIPSSIVDFVLEVFSNGYPKRYTEKMIVEDLDRFKNSMAMACCDVYAKAASEGETSHSENGISRSYDSAWITPRLLYGLPNFAKVL